MGFNTVLMICNDQLHSIEKSPTFGKRVADQVKMLGWSKTIGSNPEGYFGEGRVISCQHADYDQIVVVGQNTGRVLRDVKDPSPQMLFEMKEFMEKHGYKVSKKRKL